MAKILIANRGEIACRVSRSARMLGHRVVAVYSAADAEAPHVEIADESVLLGPGPAGASYLDRTAVLAAAKRLGADAVHPGYGFLAENAGFAEECKAAGLVFIGPSPAHIRLMGDKERARSEAQRSGVPVLPGSGLLPRDESGIAAAAAEVGFPLLIKASAGGGGIGMRLVQDPANLSKDVSVTRDLARKAFGDDGVYLERFIPRARHVEVQIFGLGSRGAVHLFERECSLQRRHQKVIEEARAPNIPDRVKEALTEAAVALAKAIEYSGAGTIEFLYDDERERFYFLEMNTRIQVEHPVTEEVTGVDLIGAQIRFALGEDLTAELSQASIRCDGHAIEARIYAEKPHKGFLPSPGKIVHISIPTGDGIRVDSGYRAGQSVTPFYDPMLMKVIARGTDRDDALKILAGALAELRIEGIETNKDFLERLLRRPEVREGRVWTRFIEERLAELIV